MDFLFVFLHDLTNARQTLRMSFTVCIFLKLTQITKKTSWLSLPSGSSSGGGALETIAYYENQGILMTVQAAEDEGQKQTKCEHYNLYFPNQNKIRN